MKIDYSGKNVLVTGGTKGIGRQLVADFKKCGADNVYFTGRGICTATNYIQFDFLKDDYQKFHDIICELDIDVCVNNAGFNKIGEIDSYSDKDWDDIIHLNLTIPFKVTKSIIPNMKSNGYGRIINITSISSEISMPLRSAYCSSKFGLLGLSKVSSVELSKHGILVNSIGPGVTETELTKNVLGEEKMSEIASNIPIGRLANVEDISNVTMFVASELNTYMVGQNIIIDGGYTCV